MKKTTKAQIVIAIMLATAFIFGVVLDVIRERQYKEMTDAYGRMQETLSEPDVIETKEVVKEQPYIEFSTTVMPEGHWEEYCLYPENERGYRSKGALIRLSGGDCKASWRVIKVWEK